jgi:predicted Zn-dependent protease
MPPAAAWPGFYFDGSSRQPVTVTITPAALYLTKTDGTHVYWPLTEVRQTPDGLQRGGESLTVDDLRGFLAALGEIGRPRPASWLGPWGWVFVGAGLVVLPAAPVIYFWGLPAVAAATASFVPVSLEEQIGRAAADSLVAGRRPCNDPRTIQHLEQLVETLRQAGPSSPYRFRITVVDDPLVNAFAAPGGYLVVFRGLLEKTKSTEEVAGVLAHEMQHVLRRHTTRAIFRELALYALLAVVLGDASPLLTGLAGTLGSLRLQREDELEADREAMHLLQSARIDPRGLIRFLESLDDQPAPPTYLSTHPPTPDRLRALERLAAAAHPGSTRLPPVPSSCVAPGQ